MKALLLDVGNTRLKWGIAEDGEIHRTGHIAQEKIREQGLSVLTTRLPRRVDAAMASNVAGTTYATRLAGLIHAHCDRDLRFAKTAKSAFGIRSAYSQPRQLGVDRWVAMIGAWAELGSSCLVVDAGTAVTIDALDGKGQHLGGQILPGVALMARALADETSDLPQVTPAKAPSGMEVFAKNTRAAVGSGTFGAVAGAIEHAIRTLRSNAYRPKLVLTGGDASRILGALDESTLHRPNLVLAGLSHMLEAER